MTTHRHKTHTSAFTLIELLLASIIGALIAASAVSVLRVAIISRQETHQHIEAAAPIRIAAAQIQQDLANLYRPQTGQTKFIGSCDELADPPASRIIFHAVSRRKARPQLPEGDVYEIEYFLQQTDAGSCLMRRLWPNPNPDDSPAGILIPLAENIVGFEVAYYDGKDWVHQWPEQLNRVPNLMAVTLIGHADGEHQATVAHQFSFHPPRWPYYQDNAPKPADDQQMENSPEPKENTQPQNEEQPEPGN
jgi:type II secretion system protein J